MDTNQVNIATLIAFALLMLALLGALFRLVIGPGARDRILALDLIASITMGFILVYSIRVRQTFYLDIAIIIALISFMGTVAISTYLKQKK